jgi:sec-independent protein translocase protein TatA
MQWMGGGGNSAEEVVMGELFQPTHLLVLGVIVFLLFGAKRLPELGKGLGEGLKGFKDGIKAGGSEAAAAPAAPAVQQQSTVAQPSAAPIEPK